MSAPCCATDDIADTDLHSLHNDLRSTLSACDEAILILDRNQEQVIWFSAPCLSLFPALRPGLNIKLLEGLDHVLSASQESSLLDADLFEWQVPDNDRSSCSQHDSRRYAQVIPLNVERIAIRFSSQPQTPLRMQHYLAEREQLFSRSSTISVSEMATTLAHELNQPLGTIANILAGIQARLSTDDLVTDDVIHAIAAADEQTRYAGKVIGRIREFTETRRPDYTSFDIGRLLLESIRVFDWAFAAEGVTVLFSRKKQMLMVRGDFTMLQQVVTNLFRNAVDAMRQNDNLKREIVIHTEATDEGIKLEVIDNGQGIDSDSEKKLYTPFQTSKADGMGVGLNICRSFIELHQGKLWLTPNHDTGCTAHVLLPACSAEEDHK